MSDTATARIKCEIDGAEVHYLPAYLAEKHGMTVEQYRKEYPNAPLESAELRAKFAAAVKNTTRKAPPPRDQLFIDMAGFRMPVNWDVPPEACLPLPPSYRTPTKGKLAQDVKRAGRYFLAGRSFWAWGPPGSGKDAFPSALCAKTRTPSSIYPVNADVDIMAWFFDKNFENGETKWIFGELFKDLVYGYVSPISGRRVPKTVVLSDFDRAGRSQAEAIRLVADSIQGRVKGPLGETYPVLPGTRLIITANTMGGGDATGKYISANVLDTSILDRIERKVKFHSIDWRDEEPIIREKFPLFAEKCGHLLPKIGDATKVLRKAVEEENLYGEFSHRGVCTWVGDCDDMLRLMDKPPKDLLKQGFLSFADGLPDEESKTLALTLVDAYLKGGALDQGDTSDVEDDDLGL
jgi:MoxR-like ATPase